MIENSTLLVAAMRKLLGDIQMLSEDCRSYTIELVALDFASIWGMLELMGILAEVSAIAKEKQEQIEVAEKLRKTIEETER